MNTIGHHTCSSEGGREKALALTPFFSPFIAIENRLPYLGEGYYFWDNNLEMAKKWGEWHYGNKYFVVESKLHLQEDLLLDLVGNRTHIMYFQKLIEKFSYYKQGRRKWELCKFIQLLKNLNDNDARYKGIFPYKIFRATDFSRMKEERFLHKFVGIKSGYTFLDPRIIICFANEESISLQDKRIL